MSLENKLISRLVGDPEAIAKVCDMGLRAEVFEEPLSRYVYDFVIEYWLESGKTAAPTVFAVETERPGFGAARGGRRPHNASVGDRGSGERRAHWHRRHGVLVSVVVS